MTLAVLLVRLAQHGISLTLTPDGKLQPSAAQQPPAEVLEGIKAHRAALVCRLERGQGPDGRYDLARLASLQGHCASCARWSPSAEWGAFMGTCALPSTAFEEGHALALHAAHRCAAHGGAGWKGVAA